MTEHEDNGSRSLRKRPHSSSSSLSAATAPVADKSTGPRPATSASNGGAKKVKADPLNIDFLLTNPKSRLANIDMKEIVNYKMFLLLSEEDRRYLLTLLPDVDKETVVAVVPPVDLNDTDVKLGPYEDMAAQQQEFSQLTDTMDVDDSQDRAPADRARVFRMERETSAMDMDGSGVATTIPLPSPQRTSGTLLQNGEESEQIISDRFFRYNRFFHDCMDAFQESLYAGYLTPEAVEKRKEAEERKKGGGKEADDAWKDENFEEYWGEKSVRDKMHSVAGDSKTITLKHMCKYDLIHKDDVLVYKRNFSVVNTLVDVSMKVIAASPTLGMTIKIDNDIFRDLETPTSLETKILDHVGTVPKDKRPNGNAFKSLKLFRGGEDLGRLFDIRKDYFEGKN